MWKHFSCKKVAHTIQLRYPKTFLSISVCVESGSSVVKRSYKIRTEEFGRLDFQIAILKSYFPVLRKFEDFRFI